MTLKTLITGGGSATSGIISQVVQPLVALVFAAAVFFFIWNVFMVITKSDQPEELANLKSRVVWGVVAIGVMASVWGLVRIVISSTGLNPGSVINVRTGP